MRSGMGGRFKKTTMTRKLRQLNEATKVWRLDSGMPIGAYYASDNTFEKLVEMYHSNAYFIRADIVEYLIEKDALMRLFDKNDEDVLEIKAKIFFDNKLYNTIKATGEEQYGCPRRYFSINGEEPEHNPFPVAFDKKEEKPKQESLL